MATPASASAPTDVYLSPSQTREVYNKAHRLIVNLGGYASGKSLAGVMTMLDRSTWDTAQRGAVFANTETQALEGLGALFQEWLDKAGVEFVFGSQAPLKWRNRWDRQRIPYPSRGLRSRSTMILDNGLHVVFGGLGGGKYKRFRGYEFGWIIVEEITEQLSPAPLNFLIPRCRCGRWGDGFCLQFHRHQVYVHGNPPPPSQPHWIRSYLRGMAEKEAKRRKDGLPPFYLRIQSSTLENVHNVGTDYVDTLTASLDAETAHAMLTGDISQVFASRAYRTFSPANVHPVPYDPMRTVLFTMDFNVSPATASLWHVLREEEIPQINKVRDSDHEAIGCFAEFYFEGGMDASSVALALIEGDHKGLSAPDNFTGLKDHRAKVYAYGDATGGMRRVESPGLRSAWHYVNSVMTENLGRRYEVMVGKSNPGVIESAETVLAMLCASNGDRTMFYDPRCKHIIRDNEEQRWKDVVKNSESGQHSVPELDDGDGTIGHLMDGVRYLAAKRYPNRGRAAVRAQTRPMVSDPFDRLSAIGRGR